MDLEKLNAGAPHMRPTRLREPQTAGPRSLTPTVEAGLLRAVGAGVPLDVACRALGLSGSTVREWLALAAGRQENWHDGTPVQEATRQRLTAFSEALACAEAEHEANLVVAINDAVGVVGKSGIPEWRPALELLKQHPRYRERWGQTVQVRHTGEVSVEYQLVQRVAQEGGIEALEALEAQLNALPE